MRVDERAPAPASYPAAINASPVIEYLPSEAAAVPASPGSPGIETAGFSAPGKVPWIPLLILAGLIFGPMIARALGGGR